MECRMHLILVLALTTVDRNTVSGCLRHFLQEDLEQLQKVTRDIHGLEIQLTELKQHQSDCKDKDGESTASEQWNDKFIKLQQLVQAVERKQDTFEEKAVSTSVQIKEMKITTDRLKEDFLSHMNAAKQLFTEMQGESVEQQKYFKEATKEMGFLNKTIQMTLNSLQDLKNASEKNLTEIQQSLERLSTVVFTDLETKSNEMKSNIDAVKKAKVTTDKMLSDLQEVLEIIRPNTFNKGAVVAAFIIVMVLVLILAVWTHRLQQKIEKMSKSQ